MRRLPLDAPCKRCGEAPRKYGSYCQECHKQVCRISYEKQRLEEKRKLNSMAYFKPKDSKCVKSS
jgi:hypothetical protein